MKKCGIYKITNLVNSKFYIGSSVAVNSRWNEHKSKLRRKIHVNPFLQKAWNKYGEDNFKFDVVELCEEKDSLDREQYYLDTLKPFRGVGYNISKIAGGGDTFSSMTKKAKKEFIKKSIHFGKDNGMFGKTHADDTIDKMKDKAKGRFSLPWFIERNGEVEGTKKYEARRLWLSNRKINYSFDNKLRNKFRRKATDVERKKISETKKRIGKLEESIKSDILSQEYTVKELCDKFGISKPTLLRRKRKYLRFAPTI